jgi:hypothetical protein
MPLKGAAAPAAGTMVRPRSVTTSEGAALTEIAAKLLGLSEARTPGAAAIVTERVRFRWSTLKVPESSATTLPPGSVTAKAALKVRQGRRALQDAPSRP